MLDECRDAGYQGIELGPVGYLPGDPSVLADALTSRDLKLIGGVLFRPFHDPDKWDEVVDGAVRTCTALTANGGRHFVLIDSISSLRAPTAGRAGEAVQMTAAEWKDYVGRITDIAKMGVEDYGLVSAIHPHAGGFCDFEPEVERLLSEIDPALLKICLDTGHSHYAGFDPVAFMRRHMDRISYLHFKDADPQVKAQVIANRTDFYEACAQGIFCILGQGETDFSAVRSLLLKHGFNGWCTVEQDCDPRGGTSPIDDARANRAYLRSIGFD